MRWLAIVILVAPALARANVQVPELPGEREFLSCEKYPPSRKFRWSVRGEVTLPDLVASLADLTCQPIVVGAQAAARAGKVMLEVPDLLTAPEVYRLFHASLEAMGLTVEKSGKALKIVDSGRAREISLLDGSGASPEQFVTRLHRLEHAGVQEMAELLGKLKGKDGDIAIYAPGRALILTDRAGNLRRMEELARALDVPQPGQRIFTLAVRGRSASDLGASVEKILSATRRPNDAKAAAGSLLADGVSAIIPVDGARAIAMVGTDAGFRRVQQLLLRLDPVLDGGAEGGARMHVLYLAHTNAEEMAQTLAGLGIGKSAKGESELKIGPDKVTNALVVYASGPEFVMVRDLVSRLDLPRRQVYVEAMILDVSVDKARNLGLVFHNGSDLGGATAVVAGGSRGFNSAVLSTEMLAGALGTGGLVAGVFGESMKIAGQSIPSFGVLLQALEHTRDVNVLSRPHLLTMDNAKASLSVGQSIPFQSSSLGSTAGTSLLASYQRLDVALKLDLTPHLNDSDSVRLELDGEISDVPDGQTAGTAGGPITNKRTLKTAVVVRDGETIVLGGLQKESESETVNKIPGLGDIPLLGKLFQHKARQRVKQDLLIVLTPHVIRSPEDLRRIFERRAAERREFLERCTVFSNDSAFSARVDFRTRRGLLEEINVAARDAESQARAVREAQRALERPRTVEGPIDDGA